MHMPYMIMHNHGICISLPMQACAQGAFAMVAHSRAGLLHSISAGTSCSGNHHMPCVMHVIQLLCRRPWPAGSCT